MTDTTDTLKALRSSLNRARQSLAPHAPPNDLLSQCDRLLTDVTAKLGDYFSAANPASNPAPLPPTAKKNVTDMVRALGIAHAMIVMNPTAKESVARCIELGDKLYDELSA